MEEGRAGRWRNELGEAGRGGHGVNDGVKEEGREGRKKELRNKGGEADRGEHEVRG